MTGRFLSRRHEEAEYESQMNMHRPLPVGKFVSFSGGIQSMI